MQDFIPPFDWHQVVTSLWTENFPVFGWILLMGFLVAAACGLIGNYLILRRMALVGDAISHSVLPGIAIAYILTHTRSGPTMFAGAILAGVLTTLLIEVIHRRTRVKQDAAIGIVFSTLFAVGVILVSLYAGQIDLDADCVLYGQIGFILEEPLVSFAGLQAPEPIFTMAGVCLSVALLIGLFYKELLVSSFDPGLAASLGIPAHVVHYALMCVLSVVVVSAFESVGAILVIAMLILPGATASLLAHRLPTILGLTILHAVLSVILGLHLALWLQCEIAAAMVVAGAALFALAWLWHLL